MEEKIVIIEDMSLEGEGIAHLEQGTCFVPYALESEEVVIDDISNDNHKLRARLVKVLKESSRRVKPKCPYFFKCGGCQIMHCNYDTQCLFKELKLKRIFEKQGLFLKIEPCVQSQEFGFRNSIQLKLEIIDNQLQVGFYERNSHKIVDLKECILCNEWSKILIKDIQLFYAECDKAEFNIKNIHAYYDQNQKGMLLVCQTNDGKLPLFEKFYEILKNDFKLGLFVAQSYENNTLLNRRTIKYLMGEKLLTIKANDKKLKIRPSDFIQTNPNVAHKLLKDVCKIMFDQEVNVVIDLYSGIGLSSILFASFVQKVYSIEENRSAVLSATENIKLNNYEDKILATLGNCNQDLDKLLDEKDLKSKLAVFVDPPRIGLKESIISKILKVKPSCIFYQSCNAKTLAYDLKLFAKLYNIVSVTPYDMFPNSEKLEILVVLTRK